MKRIYLLTAGVALLLTASCSHNEMQEIQRMSNTPKVEFDRGGTTFDFEKISKRRFASADSKLGPNLINNGNFESPLKQTGTGRWFQGKTGVHIADKALVAKLKPQVKDMPKLKIIDTADGKAAQIVKPVKIEQICGDKTTSVSASWMQTVKIPDNGGRFKLSFRYKGKNSGRYGGMGYAIVSFKDNSGKNPSSGKKTRKLLVSNYPTPKSQWQVFSTEFSAPAKTTWLTIYLRFDGTGDVAFDDVGLRKFQQEQKMTVKLMPMSLLDNTFALSSHDPAIMTFTWRRNIPKTGFELKKPIFCIDLPEEIDVKAVWKNLKLSPPTEKLVNGKKFKSYKVDLEAISKRPKLLDNFDFYLSIPLLVFTESASGTKLPNASYWIEDSSGVVSVREQFSLKVISKIKAGKKPNNFMNGFYIGGHYMNFKGADNQELLGQFIGNIASQWIVGKPEEEQRAHFRKNGVKIITPELFYIANGYRIGPPKGKPDYAKFVSIGKAGHKDVNRATCPVAIYNKSDFFKDKVVPYLKKELKGYDGLWANWEPYMFDGRGCFCSTCKNEFTKYSKLPEQEVSSAWPKEMLIGKKYYKTWVKFRSWQHAKMVKVIDETVNQSTSGKTGFIPGVAWIVMTDSERGQDFGKEHNVLDYATEFKYVDPWGPYPCWKAHEPFSYSKGPNLKVFIAANKVREYTNRCFPNPLKRPHLMALPHGIQCGTWVTQPEAITMDVISFLLNRFKSSAVYTFPKGYDNRFWLWQQKANHLIATYEPYVFNGEKYNGFDVTPVTPYPAPVKKALPRDFPSLLNSSLLQITGYKLGNKYLAAAGNFWEKGDVFFTLKANNLDNAGRYVIRHRETGRFFTSGKNKWVTGEKLQKGITLHAGALRWTFYIIEPYRDGIDYGEQVTQEQVINAINQHLPELQKSADIEKQLTAKEEAENRKSELKKLISGNLSCVPVETNEEQALQFSSGKNQLLLSLDGMAIKSWKINGTDVVSEQGKLGLGIPCFWEPPAMFTVPYLLKRQTKTQHGISIIAERTVSAKLNPSLQYITVRQKVDVSSDCKNIKITTTLINSTSDETGPRDISAGFRYHFLPNCLTGKGSITMWNGDKKVIMKRKFERLLYALKQSKAAKKVKKLFSISTPLNPITKPEAQFNAPEGLKVNMTLSPANLFSGFACWDVPKQKTSTFEPFFENVTIKPEKSVEFSMTLKIENE